MEILKEFVLNLISMANSISLFILFGLIVAGAINQIIPKDFISKHLGSNNISSILKATMLGIPIPLCSCSVIPMAKSLQTDGASSGAVSSFLISAPITGVDSLFATYSIFGWFFTIYRVISSIIIAIVVGIFQNIIDKANKRAIFSIKKPTNSPTLICNGNCCSRDNIKKRKKFSIWGIFDYAFNTLFRDIAKPLAVGLIIGALFTTFFPKELIENLISNNYIAYFTILIVSMPLYICATSSLPIALSLILNGMSAGVAFIFLSAGPATNSVTMSLVAQMFGKRSLIVYIGTIAIFSILFGILLDNILDGIEFNSYIQESIKTTSILDIISSAIMFLLMLYYIFRRD